MAEAPTFDEKAGVRTFPIENNAGVLWDDVIRASQSLNDLPVRTYKDRVDAKGIFSSQELRVAIELGHVICDPAPTAINGSSIDVRLGEHFYLAGNPRHVQTIFNPFDKEDSTRYFGDPMKAEPAQLVLRKAEQQLEDLADNNLISLEEYRRRKEHLHDASEIQQLDPEHPIILLRPRERILAHTLEFIGIRAPGTTSMQTRSTIGRTGVATCFCAGWGDPGYVNRWTMEVNNLNEFEYIPLALGQRVAQIVFAATGPVNIEYSQVTGKYQPEHSSDIAQIKELWTPDRMLPQQHKDVAELEAWRRAKLDALAA